MALQVLREIAACIKSAGWCTVMADEVTDCANDEQFIVCVRYVDKDSLEVTEDFIGVYQVDNIQSKTLAAALKDALVHMALRLDDVRGQCYDGASNMMGSKGGVATFIQKEAHKALTTMDIIYSWLCAIQYRVLNISVTYLIPFMKLPSF